MSNVEDSSNFPKIKMYDFCSTLNKNCIRANYNILVICSNQVYPGLTWFEQFINFMSSNWFAAKSVEQMTVEQSHFEQFTPTQIYLLSLKYYFKVQTCSLIVKSLRIWINLTLNLCIRDTCVVDQKCILDYRNRVAVIRCLLILNKKSNVFTLINILSWEKHSSFLNKFVNLNRILKICIFVSF